VQEIPRSEKMNELTGNITDLKFWGFDKGEWWEIGSGVWEMDGETLRCNRGHDPEWTWISSPYSYPSQFELTVDVYGEAELVGIGFGVAKDFLLPKPAEPDPISIRFVQQEKSTDLFVNGSRVTPATRSNFNIDGIESLRGGRLQLKVLNQEGPVRFARIRVVGS